MTAKGGQDDSDEQVEPDFYAVPFMPPLPVQKKERSILPAERIVESAISYSETCLVEVDLSQEGEQAE